MMSARERTGFFCVAVTMRVEDFNNEKANLYILEYIYTYILETPRITSLT